MLLGSVQFKLTHMLLSDLAVTNARRAWVIDQLGVLIRNGKIPKEDDWILSILNWLVVNGLFIVKKKSAKIPIVRCLIKYLGILI